MGWGHCWGYGGREVHVFLFLGMCLTLLLLQSSGQGHGCLGLGCPMSGMVGCPVVLFFLIDSRNLITEVGTGWQGDEDALWLSPPPPPLFLPLPLLFLFPLLPVLVLPHIPIPSSPSSSSSFCSPLFFSPLLSSPFPQVTAE